MPKILLGAAVIAAAVFTAPSAYAAGGGGGPTPYWASPWYSPNEPSATIEGRSAYVGEPVQPRGDVVHERRAHRGHRHAPALEQ
jgi:hypothetical protein